MKKTNKILILLTAIFAITIMFTLLCGFAPIAEAEEQTTEETETVVEPTFLERVKAGFQKYYDEITSFTILGVGIVDFAVLIFGIVKKLKGNTTAIATNSRTNAQVVETANSLIDTSNANTAKVDELESRIKTVENQNTTLIALASGTLKILMTVYPNSKNLPQNIKDLVGLLALNAMKGVIDPNMLPSEETKEA